MTGNVIFWKVPLTDWPIDSTDRIIEESFIVDRHTFDSWNFVLVRFVRSKSMASYLTTFPFYFSLNFLSSRSILHSFQYFPSIFLFLSVYNVHPCFSVSNYSSLYTYFSQPLSFMTFCIFNLNQPSKLLLTSLQIFPANASNKFIMLTLSMKIVYSKIMQQYEVWQNQVEQKHKFLLTQLDRFQFTGSFVFHTLIHFLLCCAVYRVLFCL